MSSILDFLSSDERVERPARFIEALLHESSLTVVIRDHRGRFVENSSENLNAIGAKPEDTGVRGENLRYFDEEGRPLSFIDTPAAIARRTGQAQLRQLFGVRYPNGQEVWLTGDQLPLEQGREGWAVLGVSADVTDLYVGRRDAQKRVRQLESLLAISHQLSNAALTAPDLTSAIRDAVVSAMPAAWIGIGLTEGDELELWSFSRWTRDVPRPRRGRMQPERLGSDTERTHVNLDVNDGDIYGFLTVGDLDHPFRSLVSVPFETASGWVTATATRPDAFDSIDIEFLERLAGLIEPALNSDLGAAA